MNRSIARGPTRKAFSCLTLRLGLLLLLTSSPLVGGTLLRVAEDRLPRSFNPLYADQLVDLRVSALMFVGLYEEDRFHRLTPVLAETLVKADNGLSVEVSLKRGLRWHSLAPITGEDVQETVRVLQQPGLASPFREEVRRIAGVEVLSPLRVRVTFHEAQREPASCLTFPILPASELKGQVMGPEHALRLHPVGAGPYKLERFDTQGNVQLVRHPTYARGAAKIPAIHLREIRDKQIQVEALRFGNLEVVVRVLPRDLPDLSQQPRVTLRPYQTSSWWYLGFNLGRDPWRQPSMRQALSSLLDVEALLKPLGGGERISGPFVPSSPYYDHQTPLPQPDPAGAARQLEAQGYTHSAQGWQRKGFPLRISLAVEKNLPVAREVAVNLQGQLERAGIQVELIWLDAAGWGERVLKARDFDLTLSQWSFDRSEDIREQFHSQGRLNYLGYRSERVDMLLDRIRREVDPGARRAASMEVHRRVAQEHPCIFLWSLLQFAAFSVTVQDVDIDPFTFYGQVHRWQLGD